QQRGLAAAVAANDADRLAAAHFKRNTAQRPEFTEILFGLLAKLALYTRIKRLLQPVLRAVVDGVALADVVDLDDQVSALERVAGSHLRRMGRSLYRRRSRGLDVGTSLYVVLARHIGGRPLLQVSGCHIGIRGHLRTPCVSSGTRQNRRTPSACLSPSG